MCSTSGDTLLHAASALWDLFSLWQLGLDQCTLSVAPTQLTHKQLRPWTF